MIRIHEETMTDLEDRSIKTIRFLSADAVQKANSGHPGLPMGTATLAYTLWMRHLRHNPRDPKWANRDRFILSGGHGSALLYSLLHLTGYDLPLEELKNFRQFGSLTPGHPEFGLTPGVETTTGPLGQGFANGVGMAIAEAHLAAEFNVSGFDIVNHFVYAIVTDGDLMEGIASEAASLAGHLKLGKLIYLYDDNHISIDGSTDLSFTEDRAARFNAYGWFTQIVSDGNDMQAVDEAIAKAKLDPRPSLILCRTIIGYGLPTRAGTSKAHGEPPGDDELNAAKSAAGWPIEPRFLIPEDVREHFMQSVTVGKTNQNKWEKLFDEYINSEPKKADEFRRRMRGELSPGWQNGIPTYSADPKGMSTRAASGKAVNAIATTLPELMGGSADLAPSNNSWIQGEIAFQSNNPLGRNFHFGVREHAMGAIVNGMCYHGGIRPYGATFLVFSDYMRPAIRLSAISHLPSIWVFTHDSIGVGEDGPTHQPVEHVASLRAIPNLVVIRPGDANETSAAWIASINRVNGPTALILSRQNMPVLPFTSLEGTLPPVERGAYILADMGDGKTQLILMASGSELSLVVDAGAKIAAKGINVRVVSFPSWELFTMQDKAYREKVFPPDIKARLAVEAGVSLGWERWVGDRGGIIAIDRYGASAPAKTLFEHYGFTVERIIDKAGEVMGL
jgi:transketolase